MYPQGYIKAYRGLITNLSINLSQSKQTVSRKLKKNPYINPIIKSDTIVGYTIKSNDSVWLKLGYTPKKTSSCNPNGNGFKNEKKIAKLKVSNAKDLLKEIKEFEVTRLTQRITCKRKNIFHDSKGRTSRTGVSILLSGKGVSDQLGYSSRMEGSRVLRSMNKKGLIKSENQKAKVLRKIHITKYKEKREREKLNLQFDTKEFFILNKGKGGWGFLMERSCNKITLKKDSFFYPSNPYKLSNINNIASNESINYQINQ
jgi:hypothetical protein